MMIIFRRQRHTYIVFLIKVMFNSIVKVKWQLTAHRTQTRRFSFLSIFSI